MLQLVQLLCGEATLLYEKINPNLALIHWMKLGPVIRDALGHITELSQQ